MSDQTDKKKTDRSLVPACNVLKSLFSATFKKIRSDLIDPLRSKDVIPLTYIETFEKFSQYLDEKPQTIFDIIDASIYSVLFKGGDRPTKEGTLEGLHLSGISDPVLVKIIEQIFDYEDDMKRYDKVYEAYTKQLTGVLKTLVFVILRDCHGINKSDKVRGLLSNFSAIDYIWIEYFYRHNNRSGNITGNGLSSTIVPTVEDLDLIFKNRFKMNSAAVFEILNG